MDVTQKQGWPTNAIQLCDVLQLDGGFILFSKM